MWLILNAGNDKSDNANSLRSCCSAEMAPLNNSWANRSRLPSQGPAKNRLKGMPMLLARANELIAIAGRDAILTMKDGVMKLATAEGDEILPGTNATAPYFTAVRDALDHWRRGAAPPISVHDCARALRLIDQAYERAG
jgi:hypothetical protein